MAAIGAAEYGQRHETVVVVTIGRDDQAWRAERRAAFEEHQAALDRRRRADTARAQEMLDDFVATLRDRNIAPVALRARMNGRSRYRTGLTGWYLRTNQSLAVDTEARFYVLDVPSSGWGPLLGLLRGVRLHPSPPPLQVGLGARDGESMALADLLDRRLSELAPPASP